MQFSRGRSEFQELYIGHPSAPPPGVDRFLAPGQGTSSRLRLLVSVERELSLYAAVTTWARAQPCTSHMCGPSLKPSWSPEVAKAAMAVS